jgi:very-short-patch-repair endonuclease
LDPHERARELRHEATDAEALLWSHIRGRRLNRCKFRRQHPIGPYITDFTCIEAGLVVELDGGQHADQPQRDRARTRYLEQRGYRVLRFWNHDVLEHTDAVLEAILECLCPSPPPSPLERDEGT